MNKSIHTEYANLTPYNIKWLDECGASWGDGTSLKDYPPSNTYLFFNGLYVDKFSQSARITEQQSDYTHLPTGDEFCRGVAEILGIEYKSENAVFSNKELEALNSISDGKPLTRKLINKLELHNKMERPLPEGTKTETVTEDKGLAIDVKLLSEGMREWFKKIKSIDLFWDNIEKSCLYIGWVGHGWFIYDLESIQKQSVPITADPSEFMRYVADKTGKEWEQKEKTMGEGALTNEDVIQLLGDKVGYGSYKAYRVLDSLDGVPLDTRIPLSEWIPPIGKKVLLIVDDLFFDGEFDRIETKPIFETVNGNRAVPLDGHWMRIV